MANNNQLVEVYVNGSLIGHERNNVFIPLGAGFIGTSSSNSSSAGVVKPVIAEGGHGAIMPDTHHVLVRRSSSDSLEPFALESTKQVGTTYISENGKYIASDDGLYAWNKVSVNVYGGVGRRYVNSGGNTSYDGGGYIETTNVDGTQVRVPDEDVKYDGYVIQHGIGHKVSGKLNEDNVEVSCFAGSYVNGLTAQSEDGQLLDISLPFSDKAAAEFIDLLVEEFEGVKYDTWMSFDDAAVMDDDEDWFDNTTNFMIRSSISKFRSPRLLNEIDLQLSTLLAYPRNKDDASYGSYLYHLTDGSVVFMINREPSAPYDSRVSVYGYSYDKACVNNVLIESADNDVRRIFDAYSKLATKFKKPKGSEYKSYGRDERAEIVASILDVNVTYSMKDFDLVSRFKNIPILNNYIVYTNENDDESTERIKRAFECFVMFQKLKQYWFWTRQQLKVNDRYLFFTHGNPESLDNKTLGAAIFRNAFTGAGQPVQCCDALGGEYSSGEYNMPKLFADCIYDADFYRIDDGRYDINERSIKITGDSIDIDGKTYEISGKDVIYTVAYVDRDTKFDWSVFDGVDEVEYTAKLAKSIENKCFKASLKIDDFELCVSGPMKVRGSSIDDATLGITLMDNEPSNYDEFTRIKSRTEFDFSDYGVHLYDITIEEKYTFPTTLNINGKDVIIEDYSIIVK